MPIWIIAVFSALTALCIFSAAKLDKQGKNDYAKSVLKTFIAYAIVFIATWIFDISVPPLFYLISMLTVAASNFIGHCLGYYDKSKVFDRYLHAFGTFSFALFTYCILDDFISTGGSLIFRALFIMLLGNTLGVIFELCEMLHDKKKVPNSQKGLVDTDMDQFFNLIGSILAGIVGYLWVV